MSRLKLKWKSTTTCWNTLNATQQFMYTSSSSWLCCRPARAERSDPLKHHRLILSADVASWHLFSFTLGQVKDRVCWLWHKRSYTLFKPLMVNICRFHGYERWNYLVNRIRCVGRKVDLCIRTFPLSSDVNLLWFTCWPFRGAGPVDREPAGTAR